jgi:hypothetical protein
VSSLASDDLAPGFVVANAVLVTFGLVCWGFPVRLGWRAGRGIAWFWTILELANRVSHSTIAFLRGGYFPGVAAAPLLLFFAGWLAVIQIGEAPRSVQS